MEYIRLSGQSFDLQESYSGHTVLEIRQNTIKKLLSEPWELESDVDEDKVEECLSTEEFLQ